MLPIQRETRILATLTPVQLQKTVMTSSYIWYFKKSHNLCMLNENIWLSLADKKKRKDIQSLSFPHNGAFLPLKMLIRHSLKCPYLHYKQCAQTLEKNSEEARNRKKTNIRFPTYQTCLRQRLPTNAIHDTCSKNAVSTSVSCPIIWWLNLNLFGSTKILV